MKRCLLLVCVLAFSSTLAITSPTRADTIPGGRFGEVRLSAPRGPIRGFMVLFSRLGGWTTADQDTADALAAHDILVVGVDSGRYLTTLAATPETCHRLFNDVTAISGQLQREQSVGAYFTPIVAGIGDSGFIAEQVLSHAPSNTIAGAISIDPTANVDARIKSCPPDPSITHEPGLPGFWSIGATADLNRLIGVTVTGLRQVGAHIDIQRFGSDITEGAMLLALSEPHLGPELDATDVASLPLIELPTQHPSNMLAIVISGDGGWHDLDQTIARHLQDWGVSVVGIDSLRYFWSRKTPEETARTIDNVIRTYATRWHASSVALIGYSFGADVLPFVYNRMPTRERDKVKLMALLGLGKAADFEIKVTGWLGLPPSATALPEQPEISKVPPDLVQCFYGGDDETDSMCPALAKQDLAVIRTPGGHHFGGDYLHLAQRILNGWRHRMTGG